MTEAQPADLEQVRYAFRLGWVVAELRGRYRPDLFDTREPGDTGSFRREEYEPPLSNERSLTEIRIELLGAAEDLAARSSSTAATSTPTRSSDRSNRC